MSSTTTFMIQLAAASILLTLLYATVKIVYNLYFHPLARFDGPFLAKISNAWFALYWNSGNYPYEIAALHEKYGDIVRIAPGELSFGSVESWKEIYGHATKDRRPFLKSVTYDIPDNTGKHSGIANERDPHRHAAVRKLLSHGFSPKALKLQTDVLLQYIDLLISQMNKFGTQEEGIPMQEWYNWLTFDVIGDLAFGESFNAVEDAKPNFYIKTVTGSMHALSMGDVVRRLPILRPFASYINRDLNRDRKQFVDLSLQKARSRMARDNSRDDFFSHILSESEKTGEIDEGYLCVQAQTLLIAGSETTATVLSAITYFLCVNPHIFSRLKNEIHNKFQDPKVIDDNNTAQLPYLAAVIEEGLRIYGPAANGMPRVSPGAEVNGTFVPAGTIVHTSGWTTQHSNKYWHDPNGYHPERWLPVDHEFYDPVYASDVKAASQPFLLGPRGCIGKNLSYMEMRIILSKLVWYFDMELVDKNLDWMKDTKFYTVLRKPNLMVRFKPIARESIA